MIVRPRESTNNNTERVYLLSMVTASMRSPKILKSLGTRTIFAPTTPCVFSMEVLVHSARQCACPFRIGHFGTKAARLPTDDCNLLLHYLHRTLACDKSNSVRCDTRNRFLSVQLHVSSSSCCCSTLGPRKCGVAFNYRDDEAGQRGR